MKYFPCWNENDPHMSWTVQMDHTVKLSDQIQKKKKQKLGTLSKSGALLAVRT